MKKIIILALVFLFSIFIAYVIGMRSGNDSGARQMARHILNPKFRTDGFDVLVSEESGINLKETVIGQ